MGEAKESSPPNHVSDSSHSDSVLSSDPVDLNFLGSSSEFV